MIVFLPRKYNFRFEQEMNEVERSLEAEQQIDNFLWTRGATWDSGPRTEAYMCLKYLEVLGIPNAS